jgi:hypothetical protein
MFSCTSVKIIKEAESALNMHLYDLAYAEYIKARYKDAGNKVAEFALKNKDYDAALRYFAMNSGDMKYAGSKEYDIAATKVADYALSIRDYEAASLYYIRTSKVVNRENIIAEKAYLNGDYVDAGYYFSQINNKIGIKKVADSLVSVSDFKNAGRYYKYLGDRTGMKNVADHLLAINEYDDAGMYYLEINDIEGETNVANKAIADKNYRVAGKYFELINDTDGLKLVAEFFYKMVEYGSEYYDLAEHYYEKIGISDNLVKLQDRKLFYKSIDLYSIGKIEDAKDTIKKIKDKNILGRAEVDSILKFTLFNEFQKPYEEILINRYGQLVITKKLQTNEIMDEITKNKIGNIGRKHLCLDSEGRILYKIDNSPLLVDEDKEIMVINTTSLSIKKYDGPWIVSTREILPKVSNGDKLTGLANVMYVYN